MAYFELFGQEISILDGSPYPIAVVEVTPEMARYALDRQKDQNFRKERTHVVNAYTKTMERGKWSPALSVLFFMVDRNGVFYMIDGQHRLLSVCDSGKPQWFIVRVTHDVEDASKIDTGLPRSNRQMYEYLAPNQKPSSAWAGFMVQAVRMNRSKDKRTSYLDSSRVENWEVNEYYEDVWMPSEAPSCEPHLFQLVDACDSGDFPKAISKPVAMGMWFAMYKSRGVGKADEFWQGVYQHQSLDDSDPRKRLSIWARNQDRAATGGGGISTIRKRIAIAWNDWAVGKSWGRLPDGWNDHKAFNKKYYRPELI